MRILVSQRVLEMSCFVTEPRLASQGCVEAQTRIGLQLGSMSTTASQQEQWIDDEESSDCEDTYTSQSGIYICSTCIGCEYVVANYY